MTLGELIEHVDAIAPNQYTEEQKIAWLTAFEGKVWQEVFLTHEPHCGVMVPWEPAEDTDSDLLIREPYALDVYSNYLLSKIAEANAEIPKYNLYSTLFNTEYGQFVSWFHRHHMPIAEKGWRY